MGYLLPIWIIGVPFVFAIADWILAPKHRDTGDRFATAGSAGSTSPVRG